jgi:hypothetical protein
MRSFASAVFALIATMVVPSAYAQSLRPDSASVALVSEAPVLPATPAATSVQPHHFWDRTNILLFSGVAVSRALDYTSTKNMLARGRQEILIPDDIVYSQAGFPALEAAATGTSVGLSYLLHRTGHHSLERWLSIGHIGVTDFGVVRNYCLQSRHR